MFSAEDRALATSFAVCRSAAGWPGTVLGVLMNDPAALAALGDAVKAAPYKAPPRAPVLYIKPRNTHIGPGEAIPVPVDSPALQMGPALGVVVGRTACRVSAQDALGFVAGYTVVNDVCLPHGNFYRPGLRLRARDGFCPIANTLRPAAEVADPDALNLQVHIDGSLVFEASTCGCVRPLAQLLADISEFMTLQPGDVLLTGVPHGAPLARVGQRVCIRIPGVGELENPLVAEVQTRPRVNA